MGKIKNHIAWGSIFLLVLLACQSRRPDQKAYPNDDTPTSGSIRVAIEYNDSFAFLQQMENFTSTYTDAKLIPLYRSENDILQYLAKDSVRFAIMHRDFTAKEKDFFIANKKFDVQSTKLGYTAIGLIVGKNSPLKSLSQQQIKDLLLGKLTSIGGVSNVQMVFDNGGSSNVRYIQDTILKAKINPKVFTALNNPREVIHFVSKNENSIGFVGVDWLIDHDVKMSAELYEIVKFLQIEHPKTGEYSQPYPKQIAMMEYPFVVPIYAHNIHSTTGLASGFVTYMMSQSGRVLFQKSRMVPVFYDIRSIDIDKKMWNNF